MSDILRTNGDGRHVTDAEIFESVLSKLANVKSLGNGEAVSSCPCPDHGKGNGDRNPSLSVAIGTTHPVIFRCHAGCTQEAIAAALGYESMRELCRQDNQPFTQRATMSMKPKSAKVGRVVAEYIYHDANGEPVLKVTRTEPKGFYQHGYANGTWDKAAQKPHVIYRLPEVIAAINAGKPVFIVEGEKDVATLERLGFVATCNAGGSSNWKPAHAAYLKGADVVIIPDNDQPGRKWADAVGQSLVGVAKSVRALILNLPNVGGDVSDWVEALQAGVSPDADELIDQDIHDEFEKLIAEFSEPWTAGYLTSRPLTGDGLDYPPKPEPPAPSARGRDARMSEIDLATKKRPVLLKASDIKEEQISWLWDNRFQSNALNLISGLAGKGKSFFTIYLTACVSQGFDWCDHKECERGSVLIFNGEDSLEQVVIPRLNKHSADLSVIQILDGAVLATETDENEDAVFSLRDTDVIREAIIATSRNTGVQCRLVIIDPISNHWGDVKENSNADVRSVLKPLNKLADELGVCIVLVSHIGKGDKEHSQHRTLGSTAIPAICRTAWILYEEAGTRTLALSKGNCVIDPTVVTFTINDGIVGVTSSDTRKTADEYEAERRQVKRALEGGRPGKEPTERIRAGDWLQSELSQNGVPFVAVTELKEKWAAEGGSERTLERAKAELGVLSSQVTIDGKTFSVWHLSRIAVFKDGTATHAGTFIPATDPPPDNDPF